MRQLPEYLMTIVAVSIQTTTEDKPWNQTPFVIHRVDNHTAPVVVAQAIATQLDTTVRMVTLTERELATALQDNGYISRRSATYIRSEYSSLDV